MKFIIGFLAALILFGCSNSSQPYYSKLAVEDVRLDVVVPPESTLPVTNKARWDASDPVNIFLKDFGIDIKVYFKMTERAVKDLNREVESRSAYDECADDGYYAYRYSLVLKQGFFKNSYTHLKKNCSMKLRPNWKKSKLAEEFDTKAKQIPTEFMCNEMIKNEGLEYGTHNESSKLEMKNLNYKGISFVSELSNRNINAFKECSIIFEEIKFAKQVDDSQKKCTKMGFSLDTPDMSNCVLQLVANDASSSSTTTTVVVEGGSSDSAIADELRTMNNRGNQIYYENMMQRGMDILNCTTWPNC